MATLGEVKAHARRLFLRGDVLHALRLYDAVLAAAPLDYDARIKVADCLDSLGDKQPAQALYRAVSEFCTKTGHPLLALVAARLLEVSGQSTDDLVREIARTYCFGSPRVAKVAARVAPALETIAVDPPDLRVAPPAAFRAQAAERALRATDSFTDVPEALHKVHLLSDLSEESLLRVLKTAWIKRFPDGAQIIRQGETGTSLFLVAWGQVRVVRTTDQGDELELSRLHEGSLFGEMSLLGVGPRFASVWVAEEADLIEITVQTFAQIAHELSSVAKALEAFKRERLLRNLVASSPLFRPFSRTQQVELLKRFSAREVAAGEVVTREGDQASGLFAVLSGELEVAVTASGHQRPIGALRTGDVLGGVSCFRGGTVHATSVAKRPTTLLFLAREYVERLVENVPEVRRYFEDLSDERVMRTRLLIADDQIVELDDVSLL